MTALLDAAATLDLGPGDLIPYGEDKAKLRPVARPERGRLVLVTAITPTPAGEGKTTTAIGLVDALRRVGARACGALREPSLGPCFGVKGGGTGGGRSVLVPSTDINLHFTGDLHAVGAAHNLVAAMLDNRMHFRVEPLVDSRRVWWPRVLDVNDRSLRQVVCGLGDGHGVARETQFDITAASEVMAMLCLARDAADLRARLDRTVVAGTLDGGVVTIGDLGATGAALALLRDALLPNLVRTAEGAPVLVHGGPFANIAHGCNSVIATRTALGLADWVVTEAGFGADLGAEKFFHIKCRTAGFDPAVVVVVATLRALKWHGGVPVGSLARPDAGAVEAGLVNLAGHLDTIAAFGKPAVVAINGRKEDHPDEVAVVERFCGDRGVRCTVATHFADGGEGAVGLARAVLEAADEDPGPFAPLYPLDARPLDKMTVLARRVYGARGVVLTPRAKRALRHIRERGWDGLPVCMAKTPASLSDDPRRRGRPTGFEVLVQDVQPNTGAGFLVALLGDIRRMPGLPRRPQALDVDLVDGEIVGIG